MLQHMLGGCKNNPTKIVGFKLTIPDHYAKISPELNPSNLLWFQKGGGTLRLSTKGHYGLKAMFDLAQNYGTDPIPLKSVAERQSLSEHYLEQLIAVLRKAGLVNSVRGAQGGYILARDPSEIKVGDVIRALEGPIAPVECVNELEPVECDKADCCITRNVWARLRDSITEVMDSITLADMCRDARQAQQFKE